MGWEREILVLKENYGEEFRLLLFKSKKCKLFELKIEDIRIKPSFRIFLKIDVLRFG
jgi:hypothetical protein